jgi:hypothetical protein
MSVPVSEIELKISKSLFEIDFYVSEEFSGNYFCFVH